MDKARFSPNIFFNPKNTNFTEIFDRVEFVWEVLPRLGGFIKARNKGRKVVIGKGTLIEEGARVLGPAIIGRNCTISHGAYIRENVIIGDNVKIGHGVEVKNSIIMGNTAIAHLNYIGDSIVGSNVNIGGGVKTANFRLDGKTIRVKVATHDYIDTGLVKLGAIIGDGSKIGVNAVLNPGTILGRNCLVYPLTSVVGVHKDEEVIK